MYIFILFWVFILFLNLFFAVQGYWLNALAAILMLSINGKNIYRYFNEKE